MLFYGKRVTKSEFIRQVKEIIGNDELWYCSKEDDLKLVVDAYQCYNKSKKLISW